VYSNLARQVRQHASERAKRARRQAVLFLPLIAAVYFAYRYREQLFGVDLPVRMAAAVGLVVLGWAFARDLGRAIGPALFSRLDRSSAGTLEFLVRLLALAVAVLVALRTAGLRPHTIAVGGAITAALFALGAQQTLGNLIAGMVLLSARPFRIGDRVRLHAGGLAGATEGVVVSLGLLYTTLARGEDRIMIPNSVVLSSAVVPLREPSGVDLRARLRADVKPSELHRVLGETVVVPTRSDPAVDLEELAGDEVVVRVSATPVDETDGPPLADQVLSALARMSDGREPAER
jgi:small conductance mechanosensitive channel